MEVLSITTFLVLIAIFSWAYLLPLHLKGLGATNRIVGISYTLFILGFTFFQVLGGFLADRWGRKRMITLPGYVSAPLYLVMAMTKDWRVVTFTYFIINVMSSLQMPSFLPLIAESSERREESFAFFNTLTSLGLGAGTLAGALLLKPLGLKHLMILSAVTVFVCTLLRHTLIKETKDLNSHKPSFTFSLNRRLIYFLIAASVIALAMALTLNGPLVTLYLQESFGKSKEEINLLYAAGWIVAALLSFVAGRLSERYSSRMVLSFSVLFHPFFLIAYFSSKGLPVPPILFLLLSFILFQFFMITQSLTLASLTDEKNRGRVTGFFGAVTGVIASLGPAIGVELKITFGGLTPFFLALGLGALAFLMLFRSPGRVCYTLKRSDK